MERQNNEQYGAPSYKHTQKIGETIAFMKQHVEEDSVAILDGHMNLKKIEEDSHYYILISTELTTILIKHMRMSNMDL